MTQRVIFDGAAAKHLLFLTENKQKQILRSAQDNVVGGFSAAC